MDVKDRNHGKILKKVQELKAIRKNIMIVCLKRKI